MFLLKKMRLLPLVLLMIKKNHAVEYKGQSKEDIAAEHLINRQKLIDEGIYIPNK